MWQQYFNFNLQKQGIAKHETKKSPGHIFMFEYIYTMMTNLHFTA